MCTQADTLRCTAHENETDLRRVVLHALDVAAESHTLLTHMLTRKHYLLIF